MQKPCNKCKCAYSYKTPSGQTRYDSSNWGIVGEVCRECEKRKKYDEYLESRRQYRQGEPIKSVDEYFHLKENGESLFYFRDAIRHYGWIESMQFRAFISFLNHGYICRAVKKQ